MGYEAAASLVTAGASNGGGGGGATPGIAARPHLLLGCLGALRVGRPCLLPRSAVHIDDEKAGSARGRLPS